MALKSRECPFCTGNKVLEKYEFTWEHQDPYLRGGGGFSIKGGGGGGRRRKERKPHKEGNGFVTIAVTGGGMARRTGSINHKVELTVAVHVLEKPGNVDIHVGTNVPLGVRGVLRKLMLEGLCDPHKKKERKVNTSLFVVT